MTEAKFRYNVDQRYLADPRAFILDLVDLVSGQNSAEGLHGNTRPFIANLIRTISSRPYIDRTSAIKTLTEYQHGLKNPEVPDWHDWREAPLRTVIDRLTTSTRATKSAARVAHP